MCFALSAPQLVDAGDSCDATNWEWCSSRDVQTYTHDETRIGDRNCRGLGAISNAAARLGIATLLRDDRIPRVMIVRNEVPPAFVEWVER